MAPTLEHKGLGVHQLMGLEFPGDLTLDEARAAVKKTSYWKVIIGQAADPDKVQLFYGWRTDEGEEVVPDHFTLDQWKDGPNPFLSINDGSGGLQLGTTSPVLEDA